MRQVCDRARFGFDQETRNCGACIFKARLVHQASNPEEKRRMAYDVGHQVAVSRSDTWCVRAMYWKFGLIDLVLFLG